MGEDEPLSVIWLQCGCPQVHVCTRRWIAVLLFQMEHNLLTVPVMETLLQLLLELIVDGQVQRLKSIGTCSWYKQLAVKCLVALATPFQLRNAQFLPWFRHSKNRTPHAFVYVY
ncbi:hypothetical protein DPMN_032961 [Dreissena polymorpha]|uniref:Uncharacterized protein n=1 Tax=Dreissena polymorpha TaxID=45954 RepID=A0A9D4RKR8_DREPO|nr:hypothetical protein DPMN_032961 [Dreissena polymorpha]